MARRRARRRNHPTDRGHVRSAARSGRRPPRHPATCHPGGRAPAAPRPGGRRSWSGRRGRGTEPGRRNPGRPGPRGRDRPARGSRGPVPPSSPRSRARGLQACPRRGSNPSPVPPRQARDGPPGRDQGRGHHVPRRPGRMPDDRSGPGSVRRRHRSEARQRVASDRPVARGAPRPYRREVPADRQGRSAPPWRSARSNRARPTMSSTALARDRGSGRGARRAIQSPARSPRHRRQGRPPPRASPWASTASSTCCRTGRPPSSASSFTPPNRDAAPAARTTALTPADFGRLGHPPVIGVGSRISRT